MLDTTYKLQLKGGWMQYNHLRDRWSLWLAGGRRIDSIDANEFPTIRDFKSWGQEKLDADL